MTPYPADLSDWAYSQATVMRMMNEAHEHYAAEQEAHLLEWLPNLIETVRLSVQAGYPDGRSPGTLSMLKAIGASLRHEPTPTDDACKLTEITDDQVAALARTRIADLQQQVAELEEDKRLSDIAHANALEAVALLSARVDELRVPAGSLDATAWAAYSIAWPQSMVGMGEVFIAGSSLGRRDLVEQRVFGLRRGPVEYTPHVGLDWSEE